MTSKTIYRWILGWVIDPATLTPLVAYVWSRLKGEYQAPPWLRFFFWIKGIEAALIFIFIILATHHQNNQWLRHVAQPIIFLGYLWTLFRMAPDSRFRRYLYGACMALAIAAALLGMDADGMKWRNAIFTSTMSFIFLGLVTWELKTLALSNEDSQLTHLPAFWVLAALLVYSSGNLIFNASSNYFLHTLPRNLLPLPWMVVGLVNVIHEVMLAKAFLCPTRTSS